MRPQTITDHNVIEIMTFRQRHDIVQGAILVAAVLLCPLFGMAQDKPGRVRLGRYARQNQRNPTDYDSREVRLNFIAASWSTVLQRLADETGSTLVVLDAPNGRFSRQDWRMYTRSEAVKLLNRELSPLGYRIITKDQYLTVMKSERTRPEYRRPETWPSHTQSPIQTAEYLRQGESRGGIIQTSGEQSNKTERQNLSTARSSIRIRPQHQPPLEISRKIYDAFKTLAEPLDKGPHGLPAFRVRRRPAKKGADDRVTLGATANGQDLTREIDDTWFILELDANQNELVLTSDANVIKGLNELIRRLDVPNDARQPATRLMTGDESLPEIGRQLQAQFDQLRQKTTGQTETVTPQFNDPRQQALSAVIPRLRGDVVIQSIDDLNLIILRGNEADIEQVMQLINAIDQLAQGTQPAIDLLMLENVNSEALAELLQDVYDKLNEQREEGDRATPPIHIIPVVQPNAILIVAPEAAIPSIQELAIALDQPADPKSEVTVFRIKHAVASQVVTLLEDFYEERGGLGTRARAIADVRTNSVIIQARPRELAEIELLIKKIDTSPKASHQAIVIELKHAAAEELAEFLNSAIQSVVNPPAQTNQQQAGGFGAGQTAQELRDARSVVLEFLTTNGHVKRLIKSGVLMDIRITPDPRQNSLFVTAPKESMAMMRELIAVLDRPNSAQAAYKMFPLKHADAVAIVEMLQELFDEQNQEGELGVQLVGTDDSSSLIPLRFQADARSNTVIVTGAEDAITIVQAIILRLDKEDDRGRQKTVIKLRNAPAADVALALNTFLQSQRDLLQADPDRVSSYELLEQEVILTPEPVNNFLIISATPRYMDEIIRMTNELDSQPPQVMIQAMLVEVELNENDEFGVELGFQDSVLFDRSVLGVPGFLFNSVSPLGNNVLASPGTVGAQGLSNLGVGRASADLGFGGLVLSASSESVSVLIRALQSRRKAEILSRPQIQALDGQLATIQLGQQIPIVNGVNLTTQGVANPNVTQQETGIILNVTPRISPEGDVLMVIDAQRSGLSGVSVPIFQDTAGNIFESPIINITSASTTVSVPDGQTIVLAGMITQEDSTDARQVPWLGDIPVVKNLFRFDAHTKRRTELLIFLTPRIIHGDGDFELIKQVEAERMHYFEERIESIHGPIFSVPPEEFSQFHQPIYTETHGAVNGMFIDNSLMNGVQPPPARPPMAPGPAISP